MTAINTTILNVDEKAHGYAKIYAALLRDELQRKRAYASIVALYSLIGHLEKTDNDIQKSMTLFRNPVLNEQYEIADVYVNNWHIDVRVVTEGNGFLVPKAHLDNDIVPDFYAVVRMDNQLKTAELLGFADTAVLKKEPFDYHYYAVSFDELISYEKFLSKVERVKLTDFSDQEHEFFRANYLSLMDEELDPSTKNKLIKHLFECSQCRTEFCCFTGFEMVSCNMGKYPNLFHDQTLDIIGAQAVDSEKYKGKEETIYITDEPEEEVLSEEKDEKEEPSQEQDSAEETPVLEKEELKEETVSDILDELFSADEDIIEQEIEEEKPVNIEPQPILSESGELEIIEKNEPLEIIDEPVQYSEIATEGSDLEVISDNSEDMLSEDSNEVVLIESEPIEFAEEELEIKPSEEIEILEEETPTETITEESVQKVIVDYDEFGEPIYSYITNVAQDEVSHIEPVEDDIDILNEEFETYPLGDDDVLSDINNGSARPIEYVQNDEAIEILEEVKDVEESDDVFIEIKEEAEDDVIDDSLMEEEIQVIDEIIDDIDDDFDEENIVVYKDEEEDKVEEITEIVEEQISDDDIVFKDDEIESTPEEKVEEYIDDEIVDINDDVMPVEEEVISETKTEDVQDEVVEYDVADDSDENKEDYEEYSEEDENEEYEDDEDTVDIPEENVAKPAGKKNLLIVSALLIFALVGCGVGAFLFFKNSNQNAVSSQTPVPTENNVEVSTEPQVKDMFGASAEGGLEVPQEDISAGTEEVSTVEGELLPPPPPMEQPEEVQASEDVQNQENQNYETRNQEVQNTNAADVSTSIANAFSPTTNTVTLRAVNWLCSPQLFSDSTFTAYMQNLDNILKLNLKKNILDVTESPANNTITVKMAVSNDGNLNRVLISDSSGSEQVDNIVLQSINETFEGEKSPILTDSPQKADVYYLKVVIKL